MAKSTKPITKAEIFDTLAKELDKPKSEIKAFFAALEALMTKQLSKKGPGVFVIPGVVKISATPKKAVKGGKKAINPFTKEEIITKDKPATVKVRARGLKGFIEKIK